MKPILFILSLLSVYCHSQVMTDTVLGKPKYMKEYVAFLNDSGPYTFMKGDDEYGHAMIMKPDNLRKSMEGSWFRTNFCRYINNETTYDKNHNVTKEIWYYKSGEIVDDYEYTYDNLNRLVTMKSKNSYSEDISRYFYEKNSKTVIFKEYYYKWKDEPMRKYVGKYQNFQPMLITKFDTITKTDSIFIITNDIWKKVGNGYTESKDSIYYKKLYRVKIYNNEYKVIDEKSFDYKLDYENKKIFLSGHFKYEYDEFGNLIKSTNIKDGKYHYYTLSGKGKIIEEEKTGDYAQTSYTTYKYTKDQKLERQTLYYKDNISYDLKFEYKGNYIVKLYYLDAWGKDAKNLKPIEVIFKYKFDKHNNWTQIIKNVDGKDLYKWIREIKYYE